MGNSLAKGNNTHLLIGPKKVEINLNSCQYSELSLSQLETQKNIKHHSIRNVSNNVKVEYTSDKEKIPLKNINYNVNNKISHKDILEVTEDIFECFNSVLKQDYPSEAKGEEENIEYPNMENLEKLPLTPDLDETLLDSMTLGPLDPKIQDPITTFYNLFSEPRTVPPLDKKEKGVSLD